MFASCVHAENIPEEKLNEAYVSLDKNSKQLRLGNERFDLYLHLLKDKKVGFVGNQSSLIGKTHLVDTLLKRGIQLTAVYSPEHGFRGDADAGELIKNGKDAKTGLPIFSLYGNNKKPTKEQLKDVDVLVFDIQDVGVRFYTYISTLHYVMEAAAELSIPVIVLDKPNPNGHYVDGPIREEKWKSFVGMHPIPIVHGMTIGEYAKMINGENWLPNNLTCDLKVIPCENYSRDMEYRLPVPPSPNLRSLASIYLYPSLCLFEGTSVSVGRGTANPFEVYGHPNFAVTNYQFTPVSSYGSKDPLWKDKVCNGFLLSEDSTKLAQHGFSLTYLITAKKELEQAKVPFITSANFFDKLAGTSILREQLLAGISEKEIRKSWESGLEAFKKTRAKYLIYKD